VPGNITFSGMLKKYGLEFFYEICTDSTFDEGSIIMFSFGRELKEIKYKYMGFYNDGVTARAEISFCDEYIDDVVYIYYAREINDLYFMEREFYVMKNDGRIDLENARLIG